MKWTLFILILVLKLCQPNLDDLYFGTDSTFEVVSWNIEWFPKNGSITAGIWKLYLQN